VRHLLATRLDDNKSISLQTKIHVVSAVVSYDGAGPTMKEMTGGSNKQTSSVRDLATRLNLRIFHFFKQGLPALLFLFQLCQ